MKKKDFYFQKLEHHIKLWRDRLPLINIALFGVVVILTGAVTYLALQPVIGLKPGEDTNAKFEEFDKTFQVAQKIKFPDPAKFSLIEENNLFSTDRAEWVITLPPLPQKSKPKVIPKKIAPAPVKKVVKPKPKVKPDKIKLFGIMMFGETKKALIENLGEDKKEDKFVYVKEGDDVVGYTVKSIEPNKITVEWNGEETVITLYSL